MPDIRMPDGQVVRFPDTMSREQISGLIASKYPREVGEAGAAKPFAERETGGHIDFDGSNVPGYDPETGMPGKAQPSQATAGLTSMLEGIPIAGPLLQRGAENIAAMIGSGLTGRPQPEVRQEMGAMVDESQAAYPKTSMAGGIGGAVLGTAPMVMAAPGLFGAGSGGLLANSIMGGLSGAAIGGTDAAVRSGGDIGKIKEGALWGGGLGAAGPAAGQLIGKGVSAVASRFRGPSGAQTAFGRAAGADAVDDIASRLAALGDDAMPMDLGPNLQRQAGALAATPGKGQEIIRSAIKSRQGQAGPRVASALDDALGQSVDTVALADDLIASGKKASGPLYKAAYSKPVPYTKELETLLNRPFVAQAAKQARTLAENDEDFAHLAKQWFANVADDGTVTIQRVPNMMELDLTKRALDDMIAGSRGNERRIVQQLKTRLTDIVDDAVPEYKAARAAYGGPASVKEALEEGSTAFKNTLTPNQLRTQLMKMGQAEKDAYIQGARAAVADIMGTARNDALAARSAFQKGYNKEKLELIVGKSQADKLLRSLDAETAFTGTRDIVTGNSETAARLAAQQDVGAGGKGPGVLEQAGNLQFGTAAMRMGDRLIGGARSAAQEAKNAELAKLLTSRDPASVTRTIKMVQAAQKRGDIAAAEAKKIIQSLSVGAAQERRPLEITVTKPNNR